MPSHNAGHRKTFHVWFAAICRNLMAYSFGEEVVKAMKICGLTLQTSVIP